MTHKLILVRHGQSDWNEKNRFTGWVDIHLCDIGKKEAERASELLIEHGIRPDIVYTSRLSRAIQTANIVLDKADLLYLDTKRSWRLNERHYGALQGRNKAEVMAEFGHEQFMIWRRSFDIPPPPIADDDQYSQLNDPRYAELSKDEIPRTESLKILIDRFLPYWHSDISQDLLAGKTVIIFAHGTVLRGLVKHLDGISDIDICSINIPTGVPLVYELDETLKPIKPAEYLDPVAAAAGIAVVAAQGHKQ